MNPKFSVGERVILVCQDLPQFNGTEHTITEIKEVVFTQHNNEKLLCYELGFSYEWKGDKDYTYWRESCLREKHNPSEFSFNELMTTLITPKGLNK